MRKARSVPRQSESPTAKGAARRPAAALTDRERILAVLKYQPDDRRPVLHFGFWGATLMKWVTEGHLKEELARTGGDGNPAGGG